MYPCSFKLGKNYSLKLLLSRFILRILLHQPAAHRQIENEAPQPRDRIRRLADRFEVGQQAVQDSSQLVGGGEGAEASGAGSTLKPASFQVHLS